MTELIIAIVGVVISLVVSFIAGGRRAKSQIESKQSKAELDTFKKSTEAQDEIKHGSNDTIDEWLRNRSRK